MYNHSNNSFQSCLLCLFGPLNCYHSPSPLSLSLFFLYGTVSVSVSIPFLLILSFSSNHSWTCFLPHTHQRQPLPSTGTIPGGPQYRSLNSPFRLSGQTLSGSTMYLRIRPQCVTAGRLGATTYTLMVKHHFIYCLHHVFAVPLTIYNTA
ncbi:hypothetical protein CDEST_12193 [Colletotrichum destructivum]|uniref:Uncharacterized protein n=1 Tax=Colletotrichum destructivum TaxID=34406 RepID=A0AAX4IV72_9PEZI|nr:hypothetical protein CDEST_12193 [Colletotrichum destructivum]